LGVGSGLDLHSSARGVYVGCCVPETSIIRRVLNLKARLLVALISGTFVVTAHETLSQGSPRSRVQSRQAAVTGPVTFLDHPRLFLTKTKKAELLSKKAANHQDYVALKAYADQVISQNPWFGVRTTLSSNLNGSSTELNVSDGSMLPAANFYVRIDMELILCRSRSGNVLSGCTRGTDWPSMGRRTAPASHVAGIDVWKHDNPAGVWAQSPAMFALLVQMGDDRYLQPSRGSLSLLMTLINLYIDAKPPIYYYWHQDFFRWYGPTLAMTFDWLYGGLTAHEKALYADRFRLFAEAHLTPGICDYNCSIEAWVVENVRRLTAVETAVVSNAAAGEIYTSLMCAAASYGDNPEALSQWLKAAQKVSDWMVPGIVDGPGTGGPLPEGMQYAGESYVFIASALMLIESATGNSSYRPQLEAWLTDVMKFLFHNTLPGSTSSAEATTGSMAAGSTSLTVSSTTGWSPGMGVRAGTGYESTIVAINRSIFTMRDPAPTSFASAAVTHTSRLVTWGDALQDRSSGFADQYFYDQFPITGFMAVDLLKNSNPPFAQYTRYWLENNVRGNRQDEWHLRKFLHDDTTVPPVDYSSLPTLWSTSNPKSTGMLIGRSSWDSMGTLVQFLVGGEMYSHVHSHYNSYQIRRGGVWMSNEVYGYGVDPYPGPFATPGCNVYCRLGEAVAVGARYHNTILMNNHSGNNGYLLSTELAGAASLARVDVDAKGLYMYGRGDASGVYTSNSWSTVGYLTNDAHTFVRDFLYVPSADLVVFADRVEYASSSTSPTTWIARFTGNPTLTGQRISSEYAGQKLVQDILIPSTGSLKKVNEILENPHLDDYLTRPYYRVETVSGTDTRSEWTLQVIQLGDAGFSAKTVNTLTTTNANVAQIGSNYVVGAVKGESPALEIRYRYTGSPLHYLMGFEPDALYHVVNAEGQVAIRAPTGSGDTKSNHAGLLILGDSQSLRASGAPSPPTGLKVIR